MQKYIKNYMDYFGYSEGDYIPSELSGKPAVDIHHIIKRSQGGSDEAENLIALTRDEHDKAETYKYSKEYLKQRHYEFAEFNGLGFDS